MNVYNKTIIKLLFAFLLIMVYSVPQSIAQETKKTDEYSVAKSLGIYVFPSKDQSAEQQSQDEFECYKWAVEQSGYDPLNPTIVEAENVETGPDGSAVRGSVRGAAHGAAIGAICGDAGKGAAIGAVGGAIGGHRAGKMRQSYNQQAAQASADQQSKELEDGFKKAFSVCLEGKDYKVSL